MRKIPTAVTIIFILAYVVLTSVGAVLSGEIDIPYLAQILLLLALSVVVIAYAFIKRLPAYVGLAKPQSKSVKSCLYYVPLLILIVANGALFFNAQNPPLNLIMTLIFMIFVAFLEELLFRGFLFKVIEERSGSKAAVIISGITFGFGHIVNLFNGYTGANQIMQIAVAVLIGIVLSLLFVRTKSIVPGMVFHVLFNVVSALSVEVEPLYNYIMVGVIIAIGVAYLFYLLRGISRYWYKRGAE